MFWFSYVLSPCRQSDATSDAYFSSLGIENEPALTAWIIPAGALLPALVMMGFAYRSWRQNRAGRIIMLQLGACLLALVVFAAAQTYQAIWVSFSFGESNFNAMGTMMTGSFMVSVIVAAALVALNIVALRLKMPHSAQSAVMVVAMLSVAIVTVGWAALSYVFAYCP